MHANEHNAWYTTVLESHVSIKCALYMEAVPIVNPPAASSVLVRAGSAYPMAVVHGVTYLNATSRRATVVNAMPTTADILCKVLFTNIKKNEFLSS